jgi:hypothetical protein
MCSRQNLRCGLALRYKRDKQGDMVEALNSTGRLRTSIMAPFSPHWAAQSSHNRSSSYTEHA